MSHFKTTLGKLLEQLEQQNWRHSVYVSEPEDISAEAACFVIDTDNADLEEDDFTPSIAAGNGLQEFLSVHDLQGVRAYLVNVGILGNIEAEVFAIRHYFKWDAYPSEEALAVYT